MLFMVFSVAAGVVWMIVKNGRTRLPPRQGGGNP
jgi:hypothetical protein